MKKLQTIEEEFREIAKSNNLKGDSVELLIKLLSYNRYESELSSRVSLLEALPSRASNINSKIEHAINNMYSVYRGKNATLKFKIKITGVLSINRFEKIYSDRFNTFYYSHCIDSKGNSIYGDYTFIYGQEYELIFIKSTQVITGSMTVDSSNPHLIELLVDNVSEDYMLKDSLESSVGLETTKDFFVHLDSSLDPLQNGIVFDLTIASYGVRFYSPEADGFNSSLSYQLTYVPFLDSEIVESNFEKMSVEGAEIYYDSFEVTKPISRESVDNLLYNLQKNTVLQSRVRSNSDVLDQFRSLFSNKIVDCSLGDYDLQEDKLTVYYIPLNSDSPEGSPSDYELTKEEKDLYLDSSMYYVTKNIDFIPLYDYSNSIPLFTNLSIIIDSKIDISLVSDELKSLEYVLGATVDVNKLTGAINNLDGVLYSELSITKSDGEKIENSITALSNQYFKLLDGFTYSYKNN
jgi:hypothetical protein